MNDYFKKRIQERKNGKEVERFIPSNTDTSFLSESLLGIIDDNETDYREESLKSKYEIKDNQLILSKKISTKEMFEKFYNKPMEEITIDDIGKAEVIDWGEDIGCEIF